MALSICGPRVGRDLVQRCLPLDGGKNAIGRAARAVVIVTATPRFVFAVVVDCLARRGTFYCGWFCFCLCLRGVSRPAGRDQRRCLIGGNLSEITFREREGIKVRNREISQVKDPKLNAGNQEGECNPK